MKQEEIDDILARTLEDSRLSRGEKQVLRKIIGEITGDRQQLAIWRARAFAHAKEALAGELAGDVLRWLEDVVGVLDAAGRKRGSTRTTAVFFSDQHSCPTKITSLISQCSSTLDICVYTITDDRISKAVLDAHARGVAVRVITDYEKVRASGSDIISFMHAGMDVRTDDDRAYMHHKFAIFDQRVVLTGSYNWTRGAAGGNQENILVTGERGVAEAFGEEFERLWTRYDPDATPRR